MKIITFHKIVVRIRQNNTSEVLGTVPGPWQTAGSVSQRAPVPSAHDHTQSPSLLFTVTHGLLSTGPSVQLGKCICTALELKTLSSLSPHGQQAERPPGEVVPSLIVCFPSLGNGHQILPRFSELMWREHEVCNENRVVSSGSDSFVKWLLWAPHLGIQSTMPTTFQITYRTLYQRLGSLFLSLCLCLFLSVSLFSIFLLHVCVPMVCLHIYLHMCRCACTCVRRPELPWRDYLHTLYIIHWGRLSVEPRAHWWS